MHITMCPRQESALELQWMYYELCVLVCDTVHRLHVLAVVSSLLPLTASQRLLRSLFQGQPFSIQLTEEDRATCDDEGQRDELVPQTDTGQQAQRDERQQHVAGELQKATEVRLQPWSPYTPNTPRQVPAFSSEGSSYVAALTLEPLPRLVRPRQRSNRTTISYLKPAGRYQVYPVHLQTRPPTGVPAASPIYVPATTGQVPAFGREGSSYIVVGYVLVPYQPVNTLSIIHQQLSSVNMTCVTWEKETKERKERQWAVEERKAQVAEHRLFLEHQSLRAQEIRDKNMELKYGTDQRR
ncbi:hypothetical protein GBF38_021879 [Nibea albiflora]|uniref:Uncharacterized protein n=1 Tax=Nibea albiflora TaxID=240163 RepID=A0ACB7FH89_NIBAL|nr:hypothetical protein GBF38_021879 [Nibea albiflora]